ncbi:MAG: radical SAM protein, partial [Acidobacteriota bacterium]|nr:radical SAM protein [Acidobacteriota bacterium]
RCPYCFADAKDAPCAASADPPLSEISRWLDRLIGLGEERKFNIQISGGEPTMRPDLPEIIRLCAEKGFEYIQLNTNGRRLAESAEYAKALKIAGLSTVFLQFDGTDDAVYKKLRGAPLFAAKKAAVANCASAKLPVTLVPTILKSVNLSSVGEIIGFMLDNLHVVKGVHFQPASFFGRRPDSRGETGDFNERVTMFAVMEEIGRRTNGAIRKSDLAPVSTGHPLCCFCAAFLRKRNGEISVLRSDGGDCCCTPDPLEIVRRDRDFVLNKWEVFEAGENTPADSGGDAGETMNFDAAIAWFQRNMFTISGMAFMDSTNLDAERLRRCRVHVFAEGEYLVPFCAYYSGFWRNGVLYPVETKKRINCDKDDITAFRQLDKIPDMKRGEGCVVCMANDVFPITATDKAVGVCYL